jgi:hypothetical protein
LLDRSCGDAPPPPSNSIDLEAIEFMKFVCRLLQRII